MPQKRVSAPVSASQAVPSVSVPASAASAPKTFSAPEVAAAMGVPAKNFRAWLRKWALAGSYQTGPGGAYVFTQDDVRNVVAAWNATHRSEEHTSELQSLMRISYAVFCLKKKNKTLTHTQS